jgi:hypothetical protein
MLREATEPKSEEEREDEAVEEDDVKVEDEVDGVVGVEVEEEEDERRGVYKSSNTGSQLRSILQLTEYGHSPANKNNQTTESTSKRTPVQAVQFSGMAKKKKIKNIRTGTKIKKKNKKKNRE